MPSSIVWPSELSGATGTVLPYALREGYGYQPRSPSTRDSFGQLDRGRQVFSDAPVDFPVQWLFTAEQVAYFEGFWWHALAGGTKAFECPLQVYGALQNRTVNFHGRIYEPPQLVGATHWRVRGTVTSLRGVQPSVADFTGFISSPDILIG